MIFENIIIGQYYSAHGAIMSLYIISIIPITYSTYIYKHIFNTVKSPSRYYLSIYKLTRFVWTVHV